MIIGKEYLQHKALDSRDLLKGSRYLAALEARLVSVEQRLHAAVRDNAPSLHDSSSPVLKTTSEAIPEEEEDLGGGQRVDIDQGTIYFGMLCARANLNLQ